MISGTTELIAHIGYPTHSFKSPSIFNPYFSAMKIDAVVVPMACEAGSFQNLLQQIFTLRNLRGAIITMPHKVSVLQALTRIGPAARVAGAANAVRKAADGALEGEMFDGFGFLRAVERRGFVVKGSRVLVIGSGGVGSAIVATLAASGAGEISLYDMRTEAMESLARRVRQNCPQIEVRTGVSAPEDQDLVVNATPVGMNLGDPMPCDPSRIGAGAFVCDVVHSPKPTVFLQAAEARGAIIQGGADMLFEQIPAYLDYFGLPSTTPDHLRALAV